MKNVTAAPLTRRERALAKALRNMTAHADAAYTALTAARPSIKGTAEAAKRMGAADKFAPCYAEADALLRATKL